LQDSHSQKFRFTNDAIKETGTGDNLNPMHLKRRSKIEGEEDEMMWFQPRLGLRVFYK
jgi:hypothetical protein